MADLAETVNPTPGTQGEPGPGEKRGKKQRKCRAHPWRHRFVVLLVLIGILIGVRAAMPWAVRSYVNRTINQSPLYEGRIGDIDIFLWRGAYEIKDVRISKVTGNVPVPLFTCPRVDLAIEWKAILNGAVVGRVAMEKPELNFVDGDDSSKGGGADQTGAGGPWLEIIQDLFPFKINGAYVKNGTIRFVAPGTDPPVNVYLSQLDASIENLTNIHDEVDPLIATVSATALAMDHAKLEYQMKLDPFSYNPTFQMALKLVGLDVTKMNQLSRAYGKFDFEHGWFDLVIELDAKEGRMEGYVKPLFRNLKVLSLRDEVPEDNVVQVFWEALIGVTAEIFQNQPRDQFGTVIPLSGDVSKPGTNVMTVLFNVLHNAFVRAYLPKLQGEAESIDGLQFGPGEISDPTSVGDG
jgi:hypothetical protein